MGRWVSIFFGFVAIANACPSGLSAKVKFQGTVFEDQAFQIEDQHIRFFALTKQETVFTFDTENSEWCYESHAATTKRPAQGCLSQAVQNGKKVVLVNNVVLPVFALHGLNGKAAAVVRIQKNLLMVDFLTAAGKLSGKRVAFRDVAVGAKRFLDVQGWNCPNPHYLSCAGAHLQTAPVSNKNYSLATPVTEVELSKNLGHYHANCSGLLELTRRPQ